MRVILWLVAVLAVFAGCMQTDENTKFNPPKELPPWAYDAPLYYQPAEDLPQQETIGNGIGVYYTRGKSFFIRHPSNCQVSGVPRVAVYYSLDQGQDWSKAGYYGVEQTHFNFLAKEEGAYWIRFVGPGQGSAECPPGQPQRIYVVDRTPPAIVLSITPSAWDDEKNQVPHLYDVGQTVRLDWGVSDRHLDPNSIKMGICFAEFPYNVVWSVLPETMKESGSLTVELPPQAAQHGGIRFRLEARDKAGNIGLAMTDVLHIRSAAPATTRPAPPPPTGVPRARLILPPQTQPSAPPPQPPPAVLAPGRFERGAMVTADRPGWPKFEQILSKSSRQELGWLPPAAANYRDMELQFSADDGQSWQTVAKGLKPGQPVAWTVPDVTGATCRLRVVALVPASGGTAGTEITLAMTQRFTVNDATTTAPTH
ncbi:MAG: hypothetical protein ABSH10_08140 [Phycisphaerae bacterium]|jgi:hypothetical protein